MATTQANVKGSGKEDSHISPALSISSQKYMEGRVVFKIKAYAKKSQQQKFWYQFTSFAAIVFGASVPVLINLGVDAIIPTILSLIVTILVSLEKLFHFREHWRNYDSIAAFLRTEQVQFQTQAGVYNRKRVKNQDEAFRLFVRRIEEGIKEERSDTIGMRTAEEG